MNIEEIMVANLKCSGCASTITKELLKINGLKSVDVEIEKDSVKVEYDKNTDRAEIIKKLHALGYPEATEQNGLLLQLKSYASCMIGRINNIK